MAALSGIFLRPRALGANPFATGTRREDFMRTTGVYSVLIVGGGGGGGGLSENGIWYGDRGFNATMAFGTVRVRDGVSVTIGDGGSAGGRGSGGGDGGTTSVAGVTTLSSTGGVGGSTGLNADPVSTPPNYYAVRRGGARPQVAFSSGWDNSVSTNLGRGGGSGLNGYNGGIFYNVLFRVA